MYTVTLNQMIQNNVTIFDFDYPIFREEYRETSGIKLLKDTGIEVVHLPN